MGYLEEIEKLKCENSEIKKILITAINCMSTIAESTSYGAVMEVKSLVEYCISTHFPDSVDWEMKEEP